MIVDHKLMIKQIQLLWELSRCQMLRQEAHGKPGAETGVPGSKLQGAPVAAFGGCFLAGFQGPDAKTGGPKWIRGRGGSKWRDCLSAVY